MNMHCIKCPLHLSLLYLYSTTICTKKLHLAAWRNGRIGLMEFAGVDKSARSKRGGWKMQEWKYRHHVSGVDNAGVELSARYGKGEQCGK